ncbi:MAG TPA: hypothetical protein VH877_21550 [Polyangia bacterium]|nr:hypothetical protein [Polyangia bacterium]
MRLAPWSALLALGLLAAAALRVQLGRSSGETAGPVYDPQSYYQLVNQEIAPHLEFCPLHATPLTVASFEEGSDARATELLEGVVTDGASAPPRRKSQPGPGAGDGTPEANAPARAPMRCACPHRLSAIFCLRDDPGVDRSRIERYARLSPLLDDLAIPSRWRLEVSRSGSAGSPEVQRLSFRLIPGSHRQRLPGGAIRPRYDGTIYYHPTPARAVLLDAGGNERTLGRGGAAGSKPIDAEMARWREEQQDALAGGSLHRELLRSDTLVLRHGDDSVTLRLAPEGNLLLVTVPEVRPGSDFSVSIDGAPLPSMRRRWILGLHPLQQIQLRWDAQPSLSLRFLSHRAGVLSETHFGTSGNERVFDEASGAEDYVRALAGTIREATDSLGEAYRECGRELTRPPGLSQPNMEALATADVWLTLDQVLQGAAQRALVRYAERGPLSRARLGLHRGEWRDGAELAPPPHLSLLVMDADRGDVLATAAYPSTQEVRRLLGALAQERSGPVALLAEDLESEQRRISLHLRPHPIGSVFKPLFAWSAGETDRALIDFTLPRLHAEDWRFGPGGKVQNRLVDQCLISTRRVENNTRWHFERAYLTPGFSDSCTGGAGPGDSEDLCLALATSDTYWFVELAARVMARARGLALPPLETPADQRDYGLSEVCAPQVLATRERGPRQVVCEGAASAAGRAQAMQSWFPVSCQSKDPNPICGMADLLGIQLQPIGDLSRPGTTDSFLGPLHGLVERLAAPLGDRCPELQTWRVRDESGFRWLVPSQTVWRADLMHRCTPDIEVFVEGGHINYWDNIYLGQSLGRLFIGNRALTARMVAQVEVPDAAAEGGRSEVAPLAPATPATPATGAAAGTAQQAAPAAVLAVSESCAGAADTPRCRVLRGLELAIRRGTLAELRELPAWLGAEHGGKAGGLEIGLWGKTGTLRDVYPVYQLERRPGGSRWVRSTTMRKSLHTALLLEVRMPDEARRPAQGPGAGPGTGAGTGSATAGRRVRHFVVYLWAEGVDDQFTSVEGAVPFFRPGRPGRSGRRPNGRDDRGGPGEAAPGAEVLRELINFALAEQG